MKMALGAPLVQRHFKKQMPTVHGNNEAPQDLLFRHGF